LQSNNMTINCAGQLPVQLAYLGKERACPQTPTQSALASVTGSNGAPCVSTLLPCWLAPSAILAVLDAMASVRPGATHTVWNARCVLARIVEIAYMS
jgi:hypothetical protein